MEEGRKGRKWGKRGPREAGLFLVKSSISVSFSGFLGVQNPCGKEKEGEKALYGKILLPSNIISMGLQVDETGN